MDRNARGYERLLQRITTWSQQEPDVRAAVIIGSHARADHPADAWSDLDVLLFVRDPERYTRSADWVAGFGAVWLTFVERTADGSACERRVLYEGGRDVDLALNPAQWLQHMVANGLAPEMADVIRRGVRVLADKDGLAAKILQLPVPDDERGCNMPGTPRGLSGRENSMFSFIALESRL